MHRIFSCAPSMGDALCWMPKPERTDDVVGVLLFQGAVLRNDCFQWLRQCHALKKELIFTPDFWQDIWPSLSETLQRAVNNVFWDLEMGVAVSFLVFQQVPGEVCKVFVGFLTFLIEYVWWLCLAVVRDVTISCLPCISDGILPCPWEKGRKD